MINSKEINLKNYKDGVTLIIDFKIESNPFFVIITDPSGTVTFYYRQFDKGKLKLNLPFHPDVIKVWSKGAAIKDYLIMDIQKFDIPYVPNEKIMVKRPYNFDEIKVQRVPRFRTKGYEDQPAKFYPALGIIQVSDAVMSKMPQPINSYVTNHEYGHYFYGRPCPDQKALSKLSEAERMYYLKRLEEDEMECDRFALYKHINDGYNFSGGLLSLVDTLSPHLLNANRMVNIFNEIKKIHKNLDAE